MKFFFKLLTLFAVCVFVKNCNHNDSVPEKITAKPNYKYAVVVSENTCNLKDWQEVVNKLLKKHNAKLILYKNDVSESKQELKNFFPQYICFVFKPIETNFGNYVKSIHTLTRELDEDPYGDALWGIITGLTAEDALNIVKYEGPLEIKKALSGIGSGWLSYLKEGVGYSEVNKNEKWTKTPDSVNAVMTKDAPDDTTKLFVGELNSNTIDIFWTSGHATEHDWQIGYSYPNGQIISGINKLFGRNLNGEEFPVKTTNPKVYYAPGNCLIGNIIDDKSMVLSWINNNAIQMIGYTVPTWYGFMGWGVANNFFERQDLSFVEAFFATNQQLIFGLETKLVNEKKDRRQYKGHLFDKDVVAIFGDPAVVCKIAQHTHAQKPSYSIEKYITSIDNDKKNFRFVVKAKNEMNFDPIRPVFIPFDKRISDVTNIKTFTENYVITDNFILLSIDGMLKIGEQREISFDAKFTEK